MSGGVDVASVIRGLKEVLDAGQLGDGGKAQAERLLARLTRPVMVIVAGLPGSGKSSVMAMLAGPDGTGAGPDVPGGGHAGRGGRTAGWPGGLAPSGRGGDGRAAFLPGRPVSGRNGMCLDEIRIAGSLSERRAAIDQMVARADIVLWCSEAFSDAEHALWRHVPERIKDHAFLVLTKADRLLQRNGLDGAIAALRDIVAREFYGLFPLATLQALEARRAQGRSGASWKASGAQALVAALVRQVALGRAADADHALLFLRRHAFGEKTAPHDDEMPARSAAPAMPRPSRSSRAAGPAPGALLSRALELLAEGVDAMACGLPGDMAAAQEFVMDRCLAAATGLADLLLQGACDDPLIRALADDAGEGLDMIVLMQAEGTGRAAEDALSVLLQLRKALVESGAQAPAAD